MKHISRFFSLVLAAALALSLAPAARAAGPFASVADIHATPSTAGNYVRFREAGDLSALYADDNSLSGSLSMAEAIKRVWEAKLPSNDPNYKNFGFDYISYVTVDASQGTLFDGYVSEGNTGSGVAGVHRYYYGASGSNQLEDVRFVPKSTYVGDALISYNGYYHYTGENGRVLNGNYTGRIYISVNKRSSGVAYTTDGEAVRFAADDFTAFSLAETGRAFRYISFTPPDASKGTLYYNYRDEAIYDAVVTAGSRYYLDTGPMLSDVYFVPNSSYSGEFQLAFSGVDVAGIALNGSVTISVTAYGPSHSSSATGSADITYTVKEGRSVTLKSSDFDSLSRSRTGSALNYIRFNSLPSSGTLYDNSYSYNTNNSNYYVAVNRTYPSLNNIRYVADSGYNGTVTIPFVGLAQNGDTFDGTVGFTVSQTATEPLHYTVDAGKRVYFIAEDFSDACYAATGYEINYIRFGFLPSSYNGTVYNGATSLAATNSSYYRSSLNNLNFYAATDFNSTVYIPFTGYANGYTSSNGRLFSGTITIDASTVKTASEASTPIGGTTNALTYYTTGPAVSLNLYDIQRSASSALSGTPATIALTRPEGAGSLCLDFVSPVRTAAFNYRQTYPFSDASRVSFLPEAGFSGTSRISYTVADAKGNSFMGNIYFVVTPPTTSRYFSDMGNTKWAIPAVDFFRSYGTVFGNSRTGFGPNEAMRRGDFMLLLSRAFSFPGAGTASFADVPTDKYYAAAIAGARSLGIVSGSETDKFYPEDGISRQDAALYLYRALRRAAGISPGTASDLAAFRDASDVSSYAVEAMGALVRLGVFDGDYGRLYPTATLTRAETMKILYYALT